MGRTISRLTVRQVGNARPPRGRDAILLADGGNLYLQVTRGEGDHVRKSWLFRFELHGRRREMGLGATHTRSLKEAREEARRCRQLLVDGIDPIDHRVRGIEASRVEAAKHRTFGEVAAAYLRAHQEDWGNVTHGRQWWRSLTEECKAIAHVPVAAISTADILAVLQPIWRVKPETASRTRGRIERVLAAAIAAGYRRREDGNPARWDGHLQELLGAKAAAKKVKRERAGRGEHHAALPYAELASFMAMLRQRQSPSAQALEFLILTTARTDELIGGRGGKPPASWSEIDFEARKWTVPGRRMKGRRDHRVPLSDRAVQILRALRRDGDTIFDLGKLAMAGLLKRMRPGVTVHGFRATFKTWASERTSYAKDVVEAALAHRLGDNETEAAYQRGDLYEKRKRLMQAWADYCAKPVPAGATVTPLRKAGVP